MRDSQSQFGPVAEAYLKSSSHSNEAALQACLELVHPQGGPVLDVATGAGHTAYTFAPHAEFVVASDITPEMLAVVDRVSVERSIDNIRTELFSAEDIPYPAESFEGVTCRVAAHHFHDPRLFVQEAFRVIQPRGWLLLVDTVGIDDAVADEQLQRLEAARDPSHVRNYTSSWWQSTLAEAGFTVASTEVTSYPHNAYDWMDRMRVEEPTRSKVLHQIIYSEGWLRDYLRPVGEGESLTFRLHQITLLGRKS